MPQRRARSRAEAGRWGQRPQSLHSPRSRRPWVAGGPSGWVDRARSSPALRPRQPRRGQPERAPRRARSSRSKPRPVRERPCAARSPTLPRATALPRGLEAGPAAAASQTPSSPLPPAARQPRVRPEPSEPESERPPRRRAPIPAGRRPVGLQRRTRPPPSPRAATGHPRALAAGRDEALRRPSERPARQSELPGPPHRARRPKPWPRPVRHRRARSRPARSRRARRPPERRAWGSCSRRRLRHPLAHRRPRRRAATVPRRVPAGARAGSRALPAPPPWGPTSSSPRAPRSTAARR